MTTKRNTTEGGRSWIAEIVVLTAAVSSLLLFFFPKQPNRLLCIEGHENHHWVKETREIFPTLGILFGLNYRVLHLSGRPTDFLVDYALPQSYCPGDNLRLWLRPKDYERICKDPDIEKVRVYALDIQNPNTYQWTRYVPQHPHGHGGMLALGIVLAVLFLIMLVNKVCFEARGMN